MTGQNSTARNQVITHAISTRELTKRDSQFLITLEEGIGVWHDAAICAQNRSEKMVACLTLMTNRE